MVEEELHETYANGEEAPFGNQSDDNVVDIAANYDEVHLAKNLEMVRDALGFDTIRIQGFYGN
jgi:hypothetical protein